jgi:hypothetical protein
MENEAKLQMEYILHVQRLSSAERRVNAYPTSGDVRRKTYSSWQDFTSVFSKYMDGPQLDRLNSALANAPCGTEVFESRTCVRREVLDSLGFE